MSETFVGLIEKLSHGNTVSATLECSPNCPACYAERLEKRVEELPGLMRKLAHEAPNRSAEAACEICADWVETLLGPVEKPRRTK